MIDAYEIGIQLLLQDDVSAGLAVINRGLADVDRAIASTSANLAGLVNQAERAGKAVAIAAGGRERPAGAVEPKSTIASTEEERPAVREIVSDEGATSVDAVSERGVKSAMSPPKAGRVENRYPAQVTPTPSSIERDGDASAPTKSDVRETEPPNKPQTAPAIDLSNAPVASTAEISFSTSNAPLQQNGRGASALDAGARRKPPAPSTMVGVTAMVGGARALSPSPTPSHRTQAQTMDRLSTERNHVAAAPWSSVDQVAPQSSMLRPAERAMAPQSPSREHADGGVGAVMLDGRLVGQWLSEHMAREASRPPGGTSFFDARQTPAWNASGAL